MHGQTSTTANTATSRPSPSRPGWLRKHADYQRVYKAARKQFSTSMTWFVSARESTRDRSQPAAAITPTSSTCIECPRVGLTAGKVLGKAHERNRIKRRMREIIRRHLHELPNNLDLILHPRRSVITMDFAKLDAEILRIFRQARAQAQAEPRQPNHSTRPGDANTRPAAS